MRWRIFTKAVFFVVALFAISCQKQSDSDTIPHYQEFGDLTVSDTYQVEDGAAYLVIDNINTLNSILKQKEYVQNPKLIADADFNDNIAIAVVKQYNNVCSARMSMDTLLFSGDRIQVFYTLDVNFGDIANKIVCNTFEQPTFVVLTNKKDYLTIDFFENNKLIKTISK